MSATPSIIITDRCVEACTTLAEVIAVAVHLAREEAPRGPGGMESR